eukprot:6487309-Amphidinium_carterae.3
MLDTSTSSAVDNLGVVKSMTRQEALGHTVLCFSYFHVRSLPIYASGSTQSNVRSIMTTDVDLELDSMLQSTMCVCMNALDVCVQRSLLICWLSTECDMCVPSHHRDPRPNALAPSLRV